MYPNEVVKIRFAPCLANRVIARCHDIDLVRCRRVLDDGLELEELDFAVLFVELTFDVALLAPLASRGRDERLLERLDQRLAIDALVLADLVDNASQIDVHALYLFA